MRLSLFAIAIAFLTASPVSALTLKGQFIQGGMVEGKVTAGSSVTLDGQPVYVGPDGDFVFGFSRDAAAMAELSVTNAAGQSKSYPLNIAPQTYDIDRVDGLPPATVNIPEEERQRRARETAMVRDGRAPFSNDLSWQQAFSQPAEGRISGVYGSQRILNGEPRTPHYGLDVAAPVGTPIYAPATGRITLAQPDFLLEGGIVIIDHGYQVFSTLFHMNSVDVKAGDWVEAGQQLGTVGAKGRASGPHVDWRVNWGQVRLDPALVLRDKQTIELIEP